MLKLAEQLAKLKGTKILVHRLTGEGTIIFVLASGPKLNMTEFELEEEIQMLKQASKTTDPEKAEETIRTVKSKGKEK